MSEVGRSVPIDFVSAHKSFNLAAVRGDADAIRLRREIADQMSEREIAEAQRAARAWLKAGLNKNCGGGGNGAVRRGAVRVILLLFIVSLTGEGLMPPTGAQLRILPRRQFTQRPAYPNAMASS